MAKERPTVATTPESVISIVGPGMRVVGDCETDGTIRIEGKVEGSIKAGKAVVVGKEGLVEGDILTQDAIISGTVKGTISADSRLELQGTSKIEGQIRARRMQLEEGAMLNGTVEMGEVRATRPTTTPTLSAIPDSAKDRDRSKEKPEASAAAPN
jgi:cytoskeletal protein CcmA (bactofilin family)